MSGEPIKTTAAPPRGVADGRPSTIFRFTITEGADRGRVFEVPPATSTRVLIGQSSACHLRLSDPHVSRRHAAVEVHGAHLEITDLDSRNGTYANEIAIARAFLWGGEALKLGETTIRVDVTEGVAEAPLSARTSFGRLVGGSLAMRHLYPFFEQLAVSKVPLIIEGETGTGKELLTEMLHESGPRAHGPFVTLAASQIEPERMAHTLFGDKNELGVFEQAHGGTLVLDELGELGTPGQKMLLRLLDQHDAMNRAAGETTPTDVRIIATTRFDIDALVQEGLFREDLYYRLLVSRIELPPLRKRRGDITLLARHFWTTQGGTGEPPAAFLANAERYPWSGNVRELKNRIARSVASEVESPNVVEGSEPTEDRSAPSSKAAFFEEVLSQDLPIGSAREKVVIAFEREYVARALERHDGSVAKAAASSGVARRYFEVLRAKRRGPA